MTEVFSLLSYDFMKNALLAGLLTSAICGAVGAFVVAKRLVFMSGGISHAAFGGIGLGHLLGISPALGALGASALFALILSQLDSERFRAHDAVIGVLWAAGMALGIVFMQLTPGYTPDLMAYLFGDILSVTTGILGWTVVLGLAVALCIALFYKDLVAVCFDENFAAVQGMNVRMMLMLLMLLISISIVLLIQVVGIILVIALLSIPPLIGMRFTRSMAGLILASVLVGVIITLGGLLLSYRLDLPTGPVIILLGTVALAATALVPERRSR